MIELKDSPLAPGVFVSCDGQHVERRYQSGRVRILSTRTKTAKGYITVSTCGAGQRKRMFLHKLVCAAWNGLPREGQTATRHLDGNAANNHYTNLAFGTYSENAKDAVKHGTSKTAENAKNSVHKRTGERAHNCKHSDSFVANIRFLRRWGFTYSAIAKAVGLGYKQAYDLGENRKGGKG